MAIACWRIENQHDVRCGTCDRITSIWLKFDPLLGVVGLEDDELRTHRGACAPHGAALMAAKGPIGFEMPKNVDSDGRRPITRILR